MKRVYTKMKKSYERFLAAKQQGNYVEKLPAENLTPADPSTSTPLDSIKEEEPAEEDDYVVLQAAGNEDTRENNKSQPDLVTNVSNPLVNDNMPIGCIPVGVHSIKEAEAQQHSVEPPASESMVCFA